MKELTIIVVDSDPRMEGIVAALSCCCPAEISLKIHKHNAGGGEWLPIVSVDSQVDLAFCHAANLENPRAVISGQVARACLRVCYSGGGRPDTSKLSGDWLTVPRPISNEASVSSGEWREFILWVSSVNAASQLNSESLPRLLRLDYPRNATALLILTRAVLAMLSGSVSAPQGRRSPEAIWEWMREPFLPGGRVMRRIRSEVGQGEELSEEFSNLAKWLEANDYTQAQQVLNLNEPLNEAELKSRLRNILTAVEKDLASILNAEN